MEFMEDEIKNKNIIQVWIKQDLELYTPWSSIDTRDVMLDYNGIAL